jgi:hypothetical protein
LKKGKLCTVCAHRERAAIDLALARGVNRASDRSGKVNPYACSRCLRAHLEGVAKYVWFALGRLRQYWPRPYAPTVRPIGQVSAGQGEDPPFLLRRYAMVLMSCSDVYGFGRKR